MTQTRAAKKTGRRKPRRADRATPEEIEAMPALLTTTELARITGWTPEYCSTLCRDGGLFGGMAVRVGKTYAISKAKALRALGLD